MTQSLALQDHVGRGVILLILAMFLFSAMDAIVKTLTARYEPAFIVWARYASQTFWTLLILSPRLRRLLRTKHLKLQLLRSTLLFCATGFFFYALKHLYFAKAIAIFEIAPLVIIILSALVLKEQVGPRRWGAVILGFFGAMIIIRPGFDVFDPAAFLPMGAATCFAGYTIATRFLGKDEPAVTSFVYTSLVGAIVASCLLPLFWQMPDPGDWPVLITFGLLGGAGHFVLILAFTAAPASALAPITYMGLVFGSAWGFFWFGEAPDLPTWIGALVIVGAGLYVLIRENRVQKVE